MVMLLGRAVQGLDLGLQGTDTELRSRERGSTPSSRGSDPESVKVLGGGELTDELVRQLVEHARDVEFQTLPMEGVAAAAVDDLPLAVHHVVVFEQTLPDSKLAAHLALGALDGLGDHGVLDDLALLWPSRSIILENPLALEEAHPSSSRDT